MLASHARPPLGPFMASPRCASRDGRDNQRAEPGSEPVFIDTQSNGVVVHGASQAINPRSPTCSRTAMGPMSVLSQGRTEGPRRFGSVHG